MWDFGFRLKSEIRNQFMPMTPQILQHLDHLDASLRTLLERLLQEDSYLDQKLSPERWSVYEVMQHLMLSEGNSLKYLRKKTLGMNQLKTAGFQAEFRIWLLELVMRSPIKFKAPKGAGVEVFVPVESFAALSGQWQKQREELRQFLSELPLEIFDKEVYRHPRSGMLSIGGMLRFFQVHFDRHDKQIKRILQEVKPLPIV